MLSPASPPQEMQEPLTESVKGEPVADTQIPLDSSTPLDNALDKPTTGGQGSESMISSLPTIPTSASGLPTQKVSNNSGNNALQEASSVNFSNRNGYLPPPPLFPHNSFPRINSPAGLHQQSSVPPVRFTPPMNPAALQPPVPGQASGTRPSFSYNVVPHANISPATGQQFQPTAVTNQSHPRVDLHHRSPYSHTSAPGQSLGGSQTQTLPVPSQLPYPPPAGQSPASNISLIRNNQLSLGHSSEKNGSSNEAIAGDGPNHTTVSSTSVSSESNQNSSHGQSGYNPNLLGVAPKFPGPVPRPVAPSLHMPPGMPGSTGIPGSFLQVPPPSSAATQSIVSDSSQASQKANLQPPAFAPTNSTSFPGQQQMYQSYPPPYAVALPPQATWMNPSQPGVMQRAPFFPYVGGVAAPFPHPPRNVSPVTSPLLQTTGVSPMPSVGPPTAESSKSLSSLTAQSPSADHEKGSSLHSVGGEMTSKKDSDAWAAHKTEAGVIYYYNSLTGESTYEKPSNFKAEPEKITTQPVPVSWEKVPGTDWTQVTTNDGKKYYYDTKNKVSSWQIPREVMELKIQQDNDAAKQAAEPIQNSSLEADKGLLHTGLNPPALLTGGRDATTLQTPNNTVSSSALDMVKKKLQDAGGGPTISSPLPAVSVVAASNSDSPMLIDGSYKDHTVDNKEKPKDGNGDVNLSESSSESEDTDNGSTEKECIVQFKEMLKERGVAPFSKWDKELPKILFDPRFKAVSSHATRRSLFEYYVRTRAEEERKEKRAAQKAAIEGFKQLLEEASEDIGKRIDYQTFKRKWGNDQRFEALHRKERENLFNERVRSLKKAVDDEIQATRAVVVSGFKSMFRERGHINTSSRWSKIKDGLRDDPRYRAVKHGEREALFNEYLSELRAAEDEAEQAEKAKREEHEKLKRREQEMRKRKQREEQEMETLRLKVRRKEFEASYQALLVETIKDPKASWTESKARLEKDPQGRFTNSDLDQADMEKMFREHVKSIYERCAHDFRTLLAEFITEEAATKVSDHGKTVLTSWTEAKRLIRDDPRYSKLSSKERENLWLRHVDEMSRRRKLESKEKVDAEGKNRTSDDHSRRLERSQGRR